MAFVRAGNLCLRSSDGGEEQALTKDGGDDVLNGKLDWVYQEEVYGRGTWRAHWWSPDSKRIAFLRLDVKDVRFPTWGAALSCIIQLSYPREGMVNDALMTVMGAPWLNTKLAVAVSPDTDLDDPGDVYHAIATRCDPARDVVVVPNTRGSPYDPSARPLEGQYPWRIVGKMGIDATIKSRHDPADFERALPRNWGKVKLEDYL